MAIHTAQAGVFINITNSRGSDLIAVRTRIAQHALLAGATHLLWLDDDMAFPRDTALRLLEHELPVVCGNYVRKNMSGESVSEIGTPATDFERVSSNGKAGLERVDGTGMGMMMVTAEVMHAIKFPWFGHRWHRRADLPPLLESGLPNLPAWRPSFEDRFFCDRVSEAGFDIMIDHDLSQLLWHHGEICFGHNGEYALI
jgi:hypothetical protein